MANLVARDYERMLDLTIAVLDEQTLEPPWPLVTRSLRDGLSGSHGLFLADLRPASHSAKVLAWTRSDSLLRATAHSRDLGASHPLAGVYARGEMTPLTVNDVVDASAWRQNPNYELSRRELGGATRHLGVPLPACPGVVRCFVITRSGKDFSPRDRQFATQVQPLLIRLDRHLTELRRLRDSPPGSRTAIAPQKQATELGITPRELTVLGLLAENLIAVAIARRLGITVHTVTKHQENLYRKLGTTNRLATVLLAQSLGLVSTPNSSAATQDQSQRAHRE